MAIADRPWAVSSVAQIALLFGLPASLPRNACDPPFQAPSRGRPRRAVPGPTPPMAGRPFLRRGVDLLDERGSQGDRHCVGTVTGGQPGEDRLRVGPDRFGAQTQAPRDLCGRVTVGIVLEDLALAASERGMSAQSLGGGVHELLGFGGRVD